MDVIAALNEPACTLWNVPISWAEVLGDVSGALCVWLVARQHMWNWPIGLVNNTFWCVLFWSAKLYADATLQVAFFALGVYGWWTWTSPGRERVLMVRRTTPVEWAALCVITTSITALLAS
jgi:nicotinamide mononucleotide transporter